MPTELLALPPAYTFVGLYRLVTDPSIRAPVWAKVQHATVRGAAVGAAYAIFGWGVMDWVVKKWFLSGRVGDRVTIGAGKLSLNVDLVLYTHILMLLPQLGAILKFFIRKNLKIARARAYNLTVVSRHKPKEFWSQGYVEEWAQPPLPTAAQKRAWGAQKHQETWISWALWWPTQLLLRQFILFPLSPNLPLLVPFVTASLRALGTAEYLHQPYFAQKRMGPDEVWRWVEERKWAYRSFGFAASVLEAFPIVGFFFSISNRIGAAMWAHDLEKRQHLFAHGVLRPLPPGETGLFGSGGGEMTPAVVAKEKEIERQWSARPQYHIAEAEADAVENSKRPPPLPPRKGQVEQPLPPRAHAAPPPLPPRKEVGHMPAFAGGDL